MFSNFSTATATTNYTQLRDTDSRGKFSCNQAIALIDPQIGGISAYECNGEWLLKNSFSLNPRK